MQETANSILKLSSYSVLSRSYYLVMKSKTFPTILMGMMCYAIPPVTCNPVAVIGDTEIVGLRVRYSNMEANQYLKVPYAQPPIGNLRFMKPNPIHRYQSAVLKAFIQPPACPQYTKNPYPWYINSTEKSEDCLYLNIWTPVDACPLNTKAVFFWVHGGGHRYGSIRDPLYNGVPLAAVGDVVVVTVNYRLGPFGFLSSGTDDAPGNAGMWDILEGLRWVNRNILAFGGDPSRITISGESAGAMSVAMLGASPLGKGLFARILMESGSPLAPGYDKGAEANPILAQNLSTLVGCADEKYTIHDHPEEVVRCLKSVDAETLSRMDSLILPHSSVDFIPQYGDELLPSYSYKEIQEGRFCPSELFIGVNRNEGSEDVATSFPDIFGFHGQKDSRINKTKGRDLMRELNKAVSFKEALIDYYLPDSLPEDAYEEVRYRVHTSIADAYLVCPSEFNAEKCAENGGRVYFYFWVHRPSTTPWAPWMGVAHFSEVQFVFGQPLLNPQRYEQVEVGISRDIIQLWCNFIKYGKPSSNWPLYSKNNRVFQYLGLESETGCNNFGPQSRNCAFLRPYFGY